MEVAVGPPVVSIHFDDEVAISEFSAEISGTKEQGYFADDTRLVSGYRIKVGSERPVLLDASAIAHHSARFEFTNPKIVGSDGVPIGEHSLHLRLDRTVGPGVHEDYDLTNHGRVRVVVDLEASFESDFADLFDVKEHRRLHRGTIHSVWNDRARRLTTTYTNGSFTRALVIEVLEADSAPGFANGGLQFRVELDPGQSWHTCVLWTPKLNGKVRRVARPCHDLYHVGTAGEVTEQSWVNQATNFVTANTDVEVAVQQAIDDLAGLRLYRHDRLAAPGETSQELESWVPAAGVPWFVTLFGRDALIVSLQTSALSPRFALGTLRALALLQADAYDDRRDMQPGKIEHEVRHGELAALGLIPHTPYYGAHETTSLFVLVAARAWRWHGDREALAEIRPHVERALDWIDNDGDMDGDGLQEYETRTPGGYRDQGWKDAGDAIVMSDGALAKLPVALCEHQALVVAAKRAWAEVVAEAFADHELARRLSREADELCAQIEDRFWWEAEGTYYLGLDGDKRPIDAVASNAGHLLWLDVVDQRRADRVVERLMAPDMWSGWGIRTLSSEHPAYDPLSYQRGSVWPHDNAIVAAGFKNYGHTEAAAKIAKGIFEATSKFASQRLPELFAGFERDPGSFPVQYLGANVPQAWSSGAVIHLISSLIGFAADAPAGVLTLSPALPAWLPEITVRRLRVGGATVDLRVRRNHDGESEVETIAIDGELSIETVRQRRPAHS